MSVKCLHPVVILNPAAFKKAQGFDRVYIRGKVFCHIMELFILKINSFAPKKFGIKPGDVDTCYLLNSATGETLPLYIVVPCNRCIICRRRRANALSARAIMETESVGCRPLFITFTYDNLHLPRTDSGFQTLRKEDLQLFFKRLRSLLDGECIPHRLRYLACGEYGKKTKRPHYHVLLWGFPEQAFDNILQVQRFIQKAWSYFLTDDCGRRIPYYDACKSCPYNQYADRKTCASLASSCRLSGYTKVLNKNKTVVYRRDPIGSIKILPANAGAPAYITKYMVKGSNAPDSSCLPPFTCASNRGGGIGSQYLRAHKDEILNNPDLESLPVLDKVTGSGRLFYLPIDSWVKNTLLPSPSTYLKSKNYETVREFVSTFLLFEQCAQQLYRLWPMDRYIDGELHYYTDEFVDPLSRSLWSISFDHCREFAPPRVPYLNIGHWIKTREQFNEYMYTLTERLDSLARKVLSIEIDSFYFADRERYLQKRLIHFKNKYADKEINLEALAEAIACSARRSEWREYF